MKVIESKTEILQYIQIKNLHYKLFLYCVQSLTPTELKTHKNLVIFCYQTIARVYFELAPLPGKILNVILPSDLENKANEESPQLLSYIVTLMKAEKPSDWDSNTRCGIYFCHLKWILSFLDETEDNTNEESGYTRKRSLKARTHSLFQDQIQAESFLLGLKEKISHYYMFVYYWSKQIDIWMNDEPIQYNLIPGYYQIVHSFLIKFHRLTKPKFSTGLVKASKALLHTNNQLLNIYLRMLLPSVNAYDPQGVATMLNVISQWFNQLRHCKTPIDFDLQYFLSALKVLLQSDHYAIVSSALIFCHNYLDYFPEKEKYRFVAGYLIEELFFKLFLHWSNYVRDIYHRIILYRAGKLEPRSRISEYDTQVMDKIGEYFGHLKRQVESNGGIVHFNRQLEVYYTVALQEYENLRASFPLWLKQNPKHKFPYLQIADILISLTVDITKI